jgi:hypothetical protein
LSLKRFKQSPVTLIKSSPILSTVAGLIFTLINLARDYYFYQKVFISNIVFGLVFISIPTIIVYISKKLDYFARYSNTLTQDNSKVNYRDTLELLESNILGYIVPIATSVIGAASISIIFEFGSFTAEVFFIIFTCAFFFSLGSVGWYYISLYLLLHKTVYANLHVSPFKSILISAKELNRIYLHIFWTGLLIYSLIILGVWVHGEYFLLRSTLSFIWVFPMATIVIGYFILCQVSFHKILRTYKEKRLQMIDKLIEEAFNSSSKKLTNNKTETINILIEWRKIVVNESEWALGFSSASTIVFTTLLPVVSTVMDFYKK